MAEKSRILPYSAGDHQSRTWDGTSSPGHWIVTGSGSWKHYGSQQTLDASHPNWPEMAGHGDVGGPFVSIKRDYWDNCPKDLYEIYPGRYDYRGPQFAVAGAFAQTHMPPIRRSSDASLDIAGTTAIARCEPTDSTSNLAVSLGELYRDGIPAIIGSGLLKSRLRDYREMGSEYLNVEFGWRPFVSDLKKFAYTVQNHEKILTQYRRNAGRTTRQRYEFPIKTEYSDTANGAASPWPTMITPLYKTGRYLGQASKSTRFSQKQWFSGAFTYSIPSGNSFGDRTGRFLREANKLYGCVPDPEAIWNLMPWSWAADWVSNTGDVLHNLSAMSTDGLVMAYGYMMEETSETWTYVNNGAITVSGRVLNLTQNFRTTTKVRRSATPFGFGLDWAKFTPRQMAILGALSITRKPSVAF